MKLKEAQWLGILALVAVAVVLLCMWCGDDVPEDGALAAANGQSLGSNEQQPVNDLLDELADGNQTTPAATTVAPAVPVSQLALGGTPPAPATEDVAIRSLIDEKDPAQIPLVPSESVSPSPAAATVPAQSEPLKPSVHVVQKGDTFSTISKKYYGTTAKHALIQKANPSVSPKSLQVGMKLQVPPADDGAARSVASAPPAAGPTPVLTTAITAPTATRTYTVQKGDSFWRIAQKCYKDGSKFKDIQDANKAVAPDAASLKPGMVLTIP